MSRKNQNQSFTCVHCSQLILPLTNGSFRNHCPFCLYSLHVDHTPGDRKHECKGIMFPTGLKYSKHKGLQIIHRCLLCQEIKVNKIAEYTVQPDSIEELIKLK